MKVAIVGGHMTPALAVIAALPKETQVSYVGRKHAFEGDKGVSLEYQTITKMGIPFYPLTTGRVQRRLSLHTVPSLVKIPYGVTQALLLLRKIKPDIVMSFGGYLSVPVGFAASLLHIPVVIHEQTQEAGLGNKVVARFAKKVCLSWESSAKYFPKEKIVMTGNPLLKTYPTAGIEGLIPEGRLPLVVIVGGSAGSHALNVFVEKSAEKLLEKIRVIHQTGDAQVFDDFERLAGMRSQLPKDLQKRYVLTKFVDPQNIVTLFKKADLVVSRAGVNTITELLILNQPALLIPLPSGQKNEQLKNAQYFKKMGLGEYFEQSELTPEKLFDGILGMIEKKGDYINAHHQEFAKLHEGAASHIVEILENACKKSETKA